MIKGLGVDLVSVKRMEEALERFGERLLNRVFTPAEIEYCMKKRYPAPHLAGRWAIKEAFFKAMGWGWGQGLRWQEVSLERISGLRPQVFLAGETKRKAEGMGISAVWASLSHEKEFAVATVVLTDEGESDPDPKKGVLFR
jgi:holo-[acyl-carrier protein] synthase